MKLNISPEFINSSGVYIIRSTLTNDSYIGRAKNFQLRYATHLTAINSCVAKRCIPNGMRPKIGEYVLKYGAESLEFCVLEVTENTYEAERAAILKYSPTMNIQVVESCLLQEPERITNLRTLGAAIKAKRTQKGISKYRLAKDTRLTAQQLGQIEKGNVGFTVDTLLEIANYLKLDVGLIEPT